MSSTESLAKTGKISSNRTDISRRIGELFTSRFYINLHTDILDTPDIFWEFDEFSDHYSSCRSYLEIPKRVDILNQRYDTTLTVCTHRFGTQYLFYNQT